MTSSTSSAPGPRAIHRRMRARAIDEVNRAATPLELLFDLTFVAAVAQLPLASHTTSSSGTPPRRSGRS